MRVDGHVIASIEKGAVVLVGVARGDTRAEADYLARKLSGLRIYNDADGRLNASIQEAGGEFLIISQFTLLADCRKGNRPSYIEAASPEEARSLYEYFVTALTALGHRVASGRFKSDMIVQLENNGPVTVLLEK